MSKTYWTLFMKAYLIQTPKSTMQSGLNHKTWTISYGPSKTHMDPLMGWVGSTSSSPHLVFKTQEEAEAYLKQYHIAYEVIPNDTPPLKPKKYGTHFMGPKKSSV